MILNLKKTLAMNWGVILGVSFIIALVVSAVNFFGFGCSVGTTFVFLGISFSLNTVVSLLCVGSKP